jgi:ABC-type oligopeptide transport system ATPase subunit
MSLLAVEDLVKHFPLRDGLLARVLPRRRRVVRAVDGVSFTIDPGETLGLVGESGCGKTTTGRLVLRAIDPTRGRVILDGEDITALSPGRLFPFRRKVQIVFQDPYTSLNPRMTVGRIVAEPIRVHGLAAGTDAAGRVRSLLDMVGLRPEHADRYPHELSGGQRQRVGIARALAVGPRLIVADEAVSALDVSVQAQVLKLLDDVRQRFDLAVLFITHDLRVAAQVCDRIAVMQKGIVVEQGSTAEVFAAPKHEYTRALFEAAPGRNAQFGVAAGAA